jgi:putative transposase
VQQGYGSEEGELIGMALAKGWPVGSHAFKAELEKKTQRQILPAKRGRPFKRKPGEAGSGAAAE